MDSGIGRIVDLLVYDLRFPTSLGLDGSDASHPDPDYSAVYVILKTGWIYFCVLCNLVVRSIHRWSHTFAIPSSPLVLFLAYLNPKLPYENLTNPTSLFVQVKPVNC